jgi:hypothetical protein
MKISVNCPSYKRPVVETLDYLPFCKVWVDEGEYKDYVESNPPGANIVSCPAGVQGNVCRIRNYILDIEFEKGYDIVLIIDDDMREVGYWEDLKKHKVKTEEFVYFLEKYSLLAKEWGAWLWGLQVNDDKISYREYTPFSTISYVGSPFQCFVGDSGLRYDERLSLKEDYDMTLQQLNKFGRVLRLNKYYYDVKQSEQTGGCASYRNLKKEKEQFALLVKKWGSRIVKRDKGGKGVQGFDYNPIINVPLKGV